MEKIYGGIGTVTFDDVDYPIEFFEIAFSEETPVKGSFRLISSQSFEKQIREHKVVMLKGNVNNNSTSVEIRNFQFEEMHTMRGETNKDYSYEVFFSASYLTIRHAILEGCPNDECHFEFHMRGMDQTKFYYSYGSQLIHTELGEIYFKIEDRDIEGSEIIDTTLPESIVKICFSFRNDNTPLENIVELAINIVKRIVLLTRFAHGTWHHWTLLKAYSSNNCFQVYQWSKAASRKISGLDIIGPNVFDLIMESYPHLTLKIIDKYRLNVAIDWYIESINGEAPEFKLINAFTCLELLVNLILLESNKLTILEESLFEDIQPGLKKSISEVLKSHDIKGKKKRKISNKVSELNRLTLTEKILKLLKDFEINYTFGVDRPHITVDKLILVRNIITHQGEYYHGKEKNWDFHDTYSKLLHLIIRIMFTILEYHGDYMLPIDDSVIKYNMWSKRRQI